MNDKLPPLNALRMFEVTARFMSMHKAASFLFVTPAAVSKQIQLLEAFLSVKLFIRARQKLTLTPEGEKYFAHISTALNSIRHATREISDSPAVTTLKIRAHTTFSMYWLIPKLSSFHARYPEINIELTTSTKPIEFDDGDIDAAIKLGDGNWPGFISIPLVSNVLNAVCSPALAKTLKTIEDIKKTTLLHSLGRPNDWQYWLEPQGMDVNNSFNQRTYENSVLVYQAATKNQGIGIAQTILVNSLVEEGELVYPFPYELNMNSYTYYFVMPGGVPIREELNILRDWLIEFAK